MMKLCLVFFVVLFLVINQNDACNCCSSGWVPYGSSCYYFSTWTTSWTNARKSCLTKGGNLVCLTGWSEWWFAVKRMRQINLAYGTKDYWIGANDRVSEGTWRCANGSPGYLRWRTGEPNNHGNEDCVHLYSTGYMNDRECHDSSRCRFICKKSC
uniref:Toxin candidate TRINITY_DN20081_c1_g3_i1.p1 n=1 Tax=Ceriantheomorphe brasiliensis TaxID=1048506 RepID=A0A7G7WYW3_9CNID|nr:toxin candidate TRINITY_DN20081_c1_g3_i1.p1 [Ceriantheomorphe brasiliensis]